MIKRKHILIIFIITLILLVTNKYFYLTKYHIPFFSISNDKVRVDIENKSGKKIESINLSPQNISINNIEKGERKTITFNHKGEGFYQLVVKFESEKDSLISTKYIESGYFITETILNSITHCNPTF